MVPSAPIDPCQCRCYSKQCRANKCKRWLLCYRAVALVGFLHSNARTNNPHAHCHSLAFENMTENDRHQTARQTGSKRSSCGSSSCLPDIMHPTFQLPRPFLRDHEHNTAQHHDQSYGDWFECTQKQSAQRNSQVGHCTPPPPTG